VLTKAARVISDADPKLKMKVVPLSSTVLVKLNDTIKFA
jgi:hypothetical protein